MPLFSTETDRKYAMMGMRIIGDFGAAIAIPVVVFVLVGQWLDEQSGTGYKFTISAFVLAGLVSGRILYKKAKAYGAEFQSLNEEADKNKKNKEKK
ncbi:MAG: AtpZ/AtpI family protein [Candidatus Magasanikbacteria bacterium]|nr:AtpZ/AtpI family protein [Candidatus Magasanikbacteria bacterium]